MNKVPLYALFAVFLATCISKTKTFEEIEEIKKLGSPYKIEFYRPKDGQAFSWEDSAEVVITGDEELKSAMNEIESADNPEPMKGAGWNRLIIYYKDTTLFLNTNNRHIGTRASGAFYDLSQDNFIRRHTDKN